MNNNQMKTKSFTLIELLVVIVIIGILSGVIVISVTNYINDAKNTRIVAELSNLSKSFEGYSNYYVGSLCIEDTANNTAFLSYYGLTTTPIHPNYTTNATSLTTNNCYLYFSDGDNYSIRTPSVGNKGYLIQESRTQKTQPIQKTCETGWIPFGNRCVMKYEAKCSEFAAGGSCVEGTSTLVSEATGTPWVSITQDDAQAECEKIGAHLITNAEWMALARDIEATTSNWTGVVLNRGNSISLAALDGTIEGTGTSKRTHTVTNGQVIWDLAGNVWEYVDDTIETNQIPTPFGWQEYTASIVWNQNFSRSEAGPLNTSYNSTNGIGKIQLDLDDATPSGTTHVFVRGGDWSGGSISGVFAFFSNISSSHSGATFGFRCVK